MITSASIEVSFPGFEQSLPVLKFIRSGNLFTLLLSNQSITHYLATDPEAFYDWLVATGATDLK